MTPAALARSREYFEQAAAADPGYPLAYCGLSLHYFPWSETVTLVSRIRDVLRPFGLLLCRVNSTEDRNFGASGHSEIEPNYYLVNGEPKRFFDRAAIENLFAAGWNVVHLRHELVARYSLPKALWEVGLEKAACPAAAKRRTSK